MILNINNIHVSYGSIEALSNITFAVQSGEFLGVVGPNGSGKTTLLRCINGVLAPRNGTVAVDEQCIYSLTRREVAREIAVVPQHSPTVIPFTVLEVVLMGRESHLGRFSRETEEDLLIAKKAMLATGVLPLAERRADELSGGELQRVIIARALAQEPRILLLDEPTLHLDINHQLEVLQLIRDVTRENDLITVLVSHDLNAVARYSDRLVVLKHGKIVAAGTPQQTLSTELIKEVYHVEAEVFRHPMTGWINITFLRPTVDEHNRLEVPVPQGEPESSWRRNSIAAPKS